MRVAPLAIGAVAGAIVGSAATYVMLGTSTEAGAPSGSGLTALTTPSPAAAPPPRATPDTVPAPLPTAERLAVYAYTSESTEPEELEYLIQRTAALPASHRRTFELDALLLRLAEIDPQRAVRFARTLRLETERLVPLFQWWAERDADAALAEIRRFDNAGAVREIALALLDVLGDDERGLSRIEAVLSPAQIPAFRQDAAVRLAAQDPVRALRRALALGDSASRLRAVSRIAFEWAQQDPAAALALVDTITDESLRRNYRLNVLSEWARIDPDAVFEHVRASLDAVADPNELFSILSALAPADPYAVLELADGLTGDARRLAEQTALGLIAERDPYAAIAKLDAMPRNRDRDQLLSLIAQAFARQDPDGALEWARSLRPRPSANVLMSVINGIAAVDPERAVDLMLDGDLGASRLPMLPGLLMSNRLAGQDSARIAAIADRLAASNGANAVNQLGPLMFSWARTDPDAALEWLIRNAERAGRPALTQLASQLAADDPLTAAGVMNRLPPDLQGDWLQSVAAGYAQYDPEAAATWILQYQGRPGFTEGLAAIAPALAQVDPRAAARMVDRIDGPLATFTVTQVAAAWAVSDPVAAADWAMQLDDSMRLNALNSVVGNWANQDLDGARRWVLGQPRGDVRDQALQRLLSMTTVRDGEIDRQLLDAFSSDAMRQNAVVSAAATLGGRDRDAARRLVDRYVTNPQMRQQAYRMIERGESISVINRSGAGISVVSPGILIR